MTVRKQFIRDFHAGEYLDLLLVSAVSAVLAIRFFLRITGYPKVGGESLHIAHMLWGGLLMLVALIVLLSYVGRRAHQVSAFLGGVGFGTFIDEVGKFVTHDNDYFFQPAVALIYVSFVLTYLTVRSLHRRRATPEEYLVNALQEVENVAINDLDVQERDRALRYLERSPPGDPLVAALREVLQRTELVPTPDPHPLVRLRARSTELYRRLTARAAFPKLIIAFFVAQLLLKIAQVIGVTLWPGWRVTLAPGLPPLRQLAEGLTFVDWAQLASAGLAAVFVVIGIAALRESRLRAYRYFRWSILVSIFITQLFMFYHDEWAALSTLAFNLLVLIALNFLIDQESARPRLAQHVG